MIFSSRWTPRLLGLFSVVLLLGLAKGDPAPDFSLKNQDGKLVKLSELKGKPVLIYFYPKDDTPGCTKQACALRDAYAEFTKKGAVILGVSRQGQESHKKFRAQQKLPFDLLVDEDGEVAKKYGVGLMPIVGYHQRKSILVGPDQKILKTYDTVDPGAHASEVLKDLQG